MQRRGWVAAVALTTAVISAGFPAVAGLPAGVSSDRLDAVFKDFGSATPGCAMAVYRAGEVLYAKGYGMADLDNDIPISPATVFDIGSTSKQFTAAAVILLANQGKISLNDDIRKFVPEVPSYGHVITIDHLLHHTSGLRDYNELLYLAGHYFEDVTTDDDALQIIAAQKALNFTPGTRWSYSNTGFFLLSIVVERVTGQTLADYAQANLFKPLGMTTTHFRNDHSAILKRRAVAYDPLKTGGFRIDMSDWDQLGDGAVNTTVLELAKWDANFYRPAVGGTALVDNLQTRANLDNGQPTDYGRGLFLDTYRGLTRVQHGGAWAGYRAMLMRFPDQRLAIGLTCNRADAGTKRRAEAVADVLLQGVFKDTAAASAGPKSFAGAKLDPARLTGAYVSQVAQNALRFTSVNGVLVVQANSASLPMVQTGPRTFELANSPISLTFDADSKGLVLKAPGDVDTSYRRVPDYKADPLAAEAMASRYHSLELGSDWTIRTKDGVAYIQSRTIEPTALVPLDRDTFTAGDMFVVLDRDDHGSITGFDLSVSRMLKVHFDRLSPLIHGNAGIGVFNGRFGVGRRLSRRSFRRSFGLDFRGAREGGAKGLAVWGLGPALHAGAGRRLIESDRKIPALGQAAA